MVFSLKEKDSSSVEHTCESESESKEIDIGHKLIEKNCYSIGDVVGIFVHDVPVIHTEPLNMILRARVDKVKKTGQCGS